jgi:quercetin dioxygenase-like cupin family protein
MALLLPTVFQNEAKDLGGLHHQITGSRLMIIQIQRQTLPKHPHDFSATNRTYGGKGTAFINADGVTIADEGDTLHMAAGIVHWSTDLQNSKRVVAVAFTPTGDFQ